MHAACGAHTTQHNQSCSTARLTTTPCPFLPSVVPLRALPPLHAQCSSLLRTCVPGSPGPACCCSCPSAVHCAHCSHCMPVLAPRGHLASAAGFLDHSAVRWAPPFAVHTAASTSGCPIVCFVSAAHFLCEQGSWIIRQSVGTTPVLLGQKLTTKYSRGPNYLEVS